MLSIKNKDFKSLTAGLVVIAILAACTQVRASNVKSDLKEWVNNLLTPSKTTLEKAETGYTLKGNLKNKPQNLLILWEMTPENLVFMDSVRTDDKGNFEIKGNVIEPVFCQLQWGENNGIILLIDNKTQAKLSIDGSDGNYSVEGKGIEGITELKELIDLNTDFANKLNLIQMKAGNLGKTPDGYAQGLQLQASYNQILADRNKAIVDFALSKKKSLVPYFIIAFNVVENQEISLLKHATESAKSFNSNSKYSKELDSRYELEKVLAIGAVAPELNLPQPNGELLALSSLRGKVVLIDFWASWCGPCRRENPFNTQMYKKFKNKGFEIYGVSLDDSKERWKAAIESDSLTWKHVSDLKKWSSSAVPLYRVSGIPATYLLDEKGRIIAKGLRGEALQAKLEEYFASKQN